MGLLLKKDFTMYDFSLSLLIVEYNSNLSTDPKWQSKCSLVKLYISISFLVKIALKIA